VPNRILISEEQAASSFGLTSCNVQRAVKSGSYNQDVSKGRSHMQHEHVQFRFFVAF
jgi:hypothetical protein